MGDSDAAFFIQSWISSVGSEESNTTLIVLYSAHKHTWSKYRALVIWDTLTTTFLTPVIETLARSRNWASPLPAIIFPWIIFQCGIRQTWVNILRDQESQETFAAIALKGHRQVGHLYQLLLDQDWVHKLHF